MRILAIETSCDETAVALLEIAGPLEKPDIKVLGNSLMSQVALHEQYGGVYPDLAKREHEKNLPILLEKTLEEAQENKETPNIDFIAVTAGPGLEPTLWVGITVAETLGKKWGKPVIPINHMEGHIFSTLYGMQETDSLRLPALALLVSGGHTELVVVKDFGNYEIIGRTRDDAVGEAFDKVARMLGLLYPGGPRISKLAECSREKGKVVDSKFPDAGGDETTAFRFPRPMINSGNLDFSFSGLKTAVLYKLKLENRSDQEFKEDRARAFEHAAVEVLIEKTQRALLELGTEIKTVIVAGGVSTNIHLSRELNKLVSKFPNINLRLPTKYLATDNAVMIGIAAFIRISKKPEILKDRTLIKAEGNLSVSSAP